MCAKSHSRIYLSEFFVLCGGDDSREDLEELHDGFVGKAALVAL
jgi:hypothetical protein